LGKDAIPLIVLVILSLCMAMFPVSAFEYPQYCNVVAPGTKITVADVFIGAPWVDIGGIGIPPDSAYFPEPISKDDLGFLRNFITDNGLLPAGSEGKVMILQVNYPDGRDIYYKIQPDFADIEEIAVPTAASSTVPSDDTHDLYYSMVVSETPALDGGISLLPQSRSLTQYASMAGGSQKNTMNFGKIQSPVAISSLKSTRYSGTLMQKGWAK
jgi:hypothetical protein